LRLFVVVWLLTHTFKRQFLLVFSVLASVFKVK
jgi:hypothetical protein